MESAQHKTSLQANPDFCRWLELLCNEARCLTEDGSVPRGSSFKNCAHTHKRANLTTNICRLKDSDKGEATHVCVMAVYVQVLLAKKVSHCAEF